MSRENNICHKKNSIKKFNVFFLYENQILENIFFCEISKLYAPNSKCMHQANVCFILGKILICSQKSAFFQNVWSKWSIRGHYGTWVSKLQNEVKNGQSKRTIHLKKWTTEDCQAFIFLINGQMNRNFYVKMAN